MNAKIKSQKKIVEIVKNLKKQGKKVVTFNGGFDILHLGHIKSFEEAKKQGDVFVILLNSDESVQKYKGPNHPVNSENDRAKILASLECVDYIAIFDEINCKNILSKVKPNIHCNGSDWGKSCVERGVVEENGGRIHILKWQKGFSTSGLIKKTKHSKPDIKAIFLDRDGTININRPGCVREISQFKFAPGSISALKKLSKTDYKIIVITNQSGIGRGYFTENGLKEIHDFMIEELNKEGIKIDKIYYCPHLPEENCSCRKPKIGMLLKANQDFNLNLSKSWFVGDGESDIIAGREANIRTIKIGGKMPADLKLEPNHYVKNLNEAVNIILKHE